MLAEEGGSCVFDDGSCVAATCHGALYLYLDCPRNVDATRKSCPTGMVHGVERCQCEHGLPQALAAVCAKLHASGAVLHALAVDASRHDSDR